MGLADRVLAAYNTPRPPAREWPVGVGSAPVGSANWGHRDDRFSPPEYLDYIATSNEIFSAAMLRARLMSSLQLHLYRGNDADKKYMPDHPAAKLLEHVNPFWTSQRLAMMDELSMCLTGQSFWAVERTGSGRRAQPREIWWMKPSQTTPVPDEKGYLQGFIYEPVYGGPRVRFDADEVVWFRYPNPLDEFSPLSPLAAARLAADTASAMMQSNRDMFRNGLQIAGIITPPGSDKITFSQPQAEELQDQLERRFSGASRRHRWAVLRYEANFKQLQMSQKDAEFLGGINLTLRQVANAYGIPAPLLNDLENATLANLEEYTKVLWAHTLVPDSKMRAAEIKEQFLPRFGSGAPDYAEYDYSRVAALQESATETWVRDAQAMDRGGLTINEWRRRQGLPDVPWGDVWWAPLNKAPVHDAVAIGVAGPNLPDDEVDPVQKPESPRFDKDTVSRLLADLDHYGKTPVKAVTHVNGNATGH